MKGESVSEWKSLFNVSKWSPPRILVTGFALIILFGGLLLSLPFASQDGEALTPFIDSVFTATSATCVTGLVTVDTGSHFSTGTSHYYDCLFSWWTRLYDDGDLVRPCAAQAHFASGPVDIARSHESEAAWKGIVRLIRKVIFYSLSIEFAEAILFAIRWSFDMPVGKAIYFGMFHAVSFFNNAGFDLFGQFDVPYIGIPST